MICLHECSFTTFSYTLFRCLAISNILNPRNGSVSSVGWNDKVVVIFIFREERHCGIPFCSCVTGLGSAMEELFGACTLALQPWMSSAFWIQKLKIEECCTFACLQICLCFSGSRGKELIIGSSGSLFSVLNMVDQLEDWAGQFLLPDVLTVLMLLNILILKMTELGGWWRFWCKIIEQYICKLSCSAPGSLFLERVIKLDIWL